MMNTIRAMRAVGSAFGRQLLRGFLPLLISIAVVIIIVGILLVIWSAWWWFLVGPLYILLSIVAAALVVADRILLYLSPRLSTKQSELVDRIVGHLEIVSDVTSSPKIWTFIRVMYSVVRPDPDSYLNQLFDTTAAHRDFVKLVRTFAVDKGGAQ